MLDLKPSIIIIFIFITSACEIVECQQSERALHNIINNSGSFNEFENWSNESDEDWDIYVRFLHKRLYARQLFIWTLSVVEIPIMLLTLYVLCSLIKSNRVASVFVIHLILSDLMQIICLIISTWDRTQRLWSVYYYSLIVGLYFMACIACERYVLVAHPIWHKTHQTLKSSCLISVLIWFVPLTFATVVPPHLYFNHLRRSLAYLIPYPVIILCFVGTWRALSHSISLTSQKRRMILGTLFLVLLSYTFLILPSSIVGVCLYAEVKLNYDVGSLLLLLKVSYFFYCLLCLNPLADCLLYLFMRTDAADVLSSLKCCCRSNTQQISVRYTTRPS